MSAEEAKMNDMLDPLILDLVEWVAAKPRPYAEVMDAWRTSCPRLPVWEEAVARGLVTRRSEGGRALVTVTAAGREALRRQRAPAAHVKPGLAAAGA
jgi:hypothetical protein